MKMMKRIVTVMLAFVVGVSMAACGGKTGSIEDYLNQPEVKEQMDALKGAMEGSGMQIEVLAEGNKMIYRYTFETQMDDLETVVAGLESGMQAEEATFKEVARALKNEIKVENPVVVIEYLNADGSSIYTVEYNAD